MSLKYNQYTLYELNFFQRRQWANPRALILNIEGATDHSISVEQNGKYLHRITVTFLIFNRIIFRFDGFQQHHPPFISTIHTVMFKLCSLCFHYVKFPPCGRRHLNKFLFFSNVVSVVCSWNFLKF